MVLKKEKLEADGEIADLMAECERVSKAKIRPGPDCTRAD